MDTDAYRKELREHFVGQMSKNSKLQSTTQHYKDFTAQNQQKLQEYEAAYQRRHQHQHQHQHQLHRSSGGDADRLLYSSNASIRPSIADSYRQGQGDNSSNYHNHSLSSHRGKNFSDVVPTLPVNTPTHKYHHQHHHEPSNAYIYDSDSNMGGDSADSSKSHKSAKTVVTKRSSRDLRKIVKSQCKLHEVIDETLKQMCTNEGELPSDDAAIMDDRHLKEVQRVPVMVPPQCKRCTTDKGLSRHKDVTTEIAKGDLIDGARSGETVTISVDDVVNSKVINPMIRKLQRMYLNNLKEEMSLMEDLERLPHKVNEVYKATIFKQKD